MFERLNREARIAVVSAQEEARELMAREMNSQHLLLGVVEAAGDELSTVLGDYGLTAGVIRARLAESTTAAGDPFDPFDSDADALRAIGIDLQAVRDSVTRTFGVDAFDQALRRSGRRRRNRGHIPFSHGAKKALELAVRETLAHKAKEIRCEHLILGILRAGDKPSVDLITEHVDTAQLRAAINALPEKAA
ncbi:MAG TPA: Clp protease N-terminal domain-containing protein [Mycobacterium sp.]|nr:Clp protease N-terminal domain-containing protein [Mycobacterium sp.]